MGIKLFGWEGLNTSIEIALITGKNEIREIALIRQR